jgi:hypothetical protein
MTAAVASPKTIRKIKCAKKKEETSVSSFFNGYDKDEVKR